VVERYKEAGKKYPGIIFCGSASTDDPLVDTLNYGTGMQSFR
jgi:hypothetical protein